MTTSFLNDLENQLLDMNYKIYNSMNNNYLYKRLNESLEETVEVTPTLVIIKAKKGVKEHKSFYPISNLVLKGLENLIELELEQVK